MLAAIILPHLNQRAQQSLQLLDALLHFAELETHDGEQKERHRVGRVLLQRDEEGLLCVPVVEQTEVHTTETLCIDWRCNMV